MPYKRPTIHTPLPDEWGPIRPTPSRDAAVLALVEHERMSKRRFKSLSSPIEARNLRIVRERLIATLVEAYTKEATPCPL